MMRGSSENSRWESPAARTGLQTLALFILLGTGAAMAQSGADPAQAGPQTAPEMLGTRVEFGGYQHWVSDGLGSWRGLNAELWTGRRSRFVSGLALDSQTRPTGTQQNYAFMSYMNWTPSFYTSQCFSGAPRRSELAVYFPKFRYDIRANWRLRPDRRLILGAGFTHFDFGGPVKGEIYNLGTMYYRGKFVVAGDLFINRSRPGDLTSASGSLSLQYGAEGQYWLGVTAGGGRELYRVDFLSPLDVSLMSYSFDVFYRRWVSRHFGYLVSATFRDKLDSYRRAGGSVRLFFEY